MESENADILFHIPMEKIVLIFGVPIVSLYILVNAFL